MIALKEKGALYWTNPQNSQDLKELLKKSIFVKDESKTENNEDISNPNFDGNNKKKSKKQKSRELDLFNLKSE